MVRRRGKMVRIKVGVSETLLSIVDNLIERNLFRSRDEAFNLALRKAYGDKEIKLFLPAARKMKLKTVWLPELFLNAIETLIEVGVYSSRGEFIRDAVRSKLYDLSEIIRIIKEKEVE